MTPDINKIARDLAALSEEVYRNNFSASKDENKYVRFNTRMKVPHHASNPAVCEVGEIVEVGGELLICSAANTWTVVGTQT